MPSPGTNAPPRGQLADFLGPVCTSSARRRLSRSQRQRTLTIAVIEAAVVGPMLAAWLVWPIPLIQGLGAGTIMIALFSAIMMLGPAVLNPFAPQLIRWIGGNKKTVVITGYLQATLLGLFVIPLTHSGSAWAIPVSMTIGFLASAIGALGSTAWISWMGVVIPPAVRGRYWANRIVVFLISFVITGFLFAILVHYLPLGESCWALSIIFLVGAVSRVFSVTLIAEQSELPGRKEEGYRSAVHAIPSPSGIFAFIRSMPSSPVGRWMLIFSACQITAVLGGPFFVQFLCSASPKGLDLPHVLPMTYFLLMNLNPITALLVQPVVGNLVDRHGPGAVMRAGLIGVVLVPIGMTFWPLVPVLIVFELVSGVSWCMVNNASGVLLLSSHRDPVERSRLIGYYQTILAFCQVAASVSGMILIGIVPEMDGSPYRTIFLISMILRLPVLFLAIRWLPSMRFASDDERFGLWRLIPGAEPMVGLGRGLWRVVRGDD